DAANRLIGANTDRMKTDRPIRIDRPREMLPAGGEFGQRDDLSRGKLQVVRVRDGFHQAQAAVVEIRRLKKLGVADWSRIAVLSRTHDELAQVRMLAEQVAIPVRWLAERNKMPLLHQVREIHAFLQSL